jgi:hypothetical protein
MSAFHAGDAGSNPAARSNKLGDHLGSAGARPCVAAHSFAPPAHPSRCLPPLNVVDDAALAAAVDRRNFEIDFWPRLLATRVGALLLDHFFTIILTAIAASNVRAGTPSAFTASHGVCSVNRAASRACRRVRVLTRVRERVAQ